MIAVGVGIGRKITSLVLLVIGTAVDGQAWMFRVVKQPVGSRRRNG